MKPNGLVRVHNTGGEFWNEHLHSGGFTDFTTPFIENDFSFPESLESKFTHFICWGNMTPREIATVCAEIPLSNRVLVVVEPRVMEPQTWNKQTLSQFGHIYAASRQWAEKLGGEFFEWPQTRSSSNHLKNLTLPESRLKRVALIQSSKFNSISGENFSLRRLAIRRLKESGIPIDVYGSHWEASTVQNIYRKGYAFCKALISFLKYGAIVKFDILDFRAIRTRIQNNIGFVESVFDTLSKYEYCLVIENCDDYISEKLFNALYAGCKVVYVGPKLENYEYSIRSVVEVDPKSDSIVKKFVDLFSSSEILDHASIHREAANWLSIADSRIVHSKLARQIAASFSSC